MDESTSAAPPIPKTAPLAPKDHAEAVAIFRSEIVGALTRKELDHGELRAAFRALSDERFRPPGVETIRRYSVTTLERWYYAYRAGGLAALRPARAAPDTSTRRSFAPRSPCASGAGSVPTRPCPWTGRTGSSTRASSPAASSPWAAPSSTACPGSSTKASACRSTASIPRPTPTAGGHRAGLARQTTRA